MKSIYFMCLFVASVYMSETFIFAEYLICSKQLFLANIYLCKVFCDKHFFLESTYLWLVFICDKSSPVTASMSEWVM